MKIEKLNENKIRITLNMDDLKERDIDFHSFMSNSIESQGIFLDMLDTAQKEVGFNTDDCRIMIEALALKNGIFVLTITKFKHKTQDEHKDEDSPSTFKKSSLHIKRKSPKLTGSKILYSFDSFDSFCDFCNFLEKSSYKNQILELGAASSLYEYNSCYYLIFSDINPNAEILKFIYPTITEFAHYVDNSELFERKVLEYGKPVINENAILESIKYFSRKKRTSV